MTGAPISESIVQWRERLIESIDGYIDLGLGMIDVRLGGPAGTGSEVSDAVALISLLNDSLPDEHPAKITRETIAALRSAAKHLDDAPFGSGASMEIESIAESLESYLPPE